MQSDYLSVAESRTAVDEQTDSERKAMRTSCTLKHLLVTTANLLGLAFTCFAQPIPDEYIAVFTADVPDPATAARELENQHGLSISHVYQHSIRGFAFAGNEQAAQALSRNPRIAYVEQDQLALELLDRQLGRSDPVGVLYVRHVGQLFFQFPCFVVPLAPLRSVSAADERNAQTWSDRPRRP